MLICIGVSPCNETRDSPGKTWMRSVASFDTKAHLYRTLDDPQKSPIYNPQKNPIQGFLRAPWRVTHLARHGCETLRHSTPRPTSTEHYTIRKRAVGINRKRCLCVHIHRAVRASWRVTHLAGMIRKRALYIIHKRTVDWAFPVQRDEWLTWQGMTATRCVIRRRGPNLYRTLYHPQKSPI